MSNLQGGESTYLSDFLADLKGLDGRFGPLESRTDGTLVSNDSGYPVIASDVIANLPNKRSGLGIFIGGGGAFSALPELPIEAVAFIDKNPFVGELNLVLAESILDSSTPQETLEIIKTRYRIGQHAVLRALQELHDDIDTLLFSEFRVEASDYGPYHWSDPDRFPQVKKALMDTPVITVGADITNPDFAPALRNVLTSHNQRITYANFTNVHAWIGAASMKFVQDLPFHQDAAILYSSHKGAMLGEWPKISFATSVSEYLADIQEQATGTAP